jgi:transposase-like protein
MPRNYTDEEKRLVLDRLIANHGDVARTAAETGVSDRTLLRWRTENDIKPPSHGFMSSPPPTTSPTQNPSYLPSPVTT